MSEIWEYDEKSGLNWYKKEKDRLVWWLDDGRYLGRHVFSFDKVQKFNLFKDYPHKLSEEQRQIFDKEEPFWSDYFKKD